MLLLVNILDTLMYSLMGGNAPGAGASRRPATLPKLEAPLPFRDFLEHVRGCCGKLLAFLEEWCAPEANSTALLQGMGVDQVGQSTSEALLFARRQCISFSAGLYRRFVLLLSSFPWRLWVLKDGSFDDAVCKDVADELFRERGCCLGWFGRRLRAFLPDAEALLSPLGRATLSTWFRTLVWTIYGCEKEHGSCRRLLHGAGPSWSWTLAARERLLECSRTVHIERTSWDPARAPPQDRATVTERLAASVDMAPGPLATFPESRPPAIEFRIADTDVASDMTALVAGRPAAPQQEHDLAAADEDLARNT